MKTITKLLVPVIVGITAFLSITSFTVKNKTAPPSKCNPPASFEVSLNHPVNGVRNFTIVTDAFETDVTGIWTMTMTNTNSTVSQYFTVLEARSSAGNVIGQLFALSHSNKNNKEGNWKISSGTGIFEGIAGGGRLIMGNSATLAESWEGKVYF